MKKMYSLSTVLLLLCFIAALFCPALCAGAAVSYSGQGTMADPYLITNGEQLQGMRDHLSSHFKLANTVDLSGMDFKPIGRLDAPFTGSFVCELNADKTPKFAIKNLKIAVAETPYSAEKKNKWEAALFGATDGATISGIYLLDVNVSNQVFGDNQGNVIYNDYKPGMDEMNTAALIGEANNTMVTNCASTGVIDTRSNHCGGLIGFARNATLENCYSTINVTSAGKWSVGGLIGTAENCTITSCYSTGNTKGSQSNINGFIGSVKGGVFTDCYSLGNSSGGKERKASFVTWGESSAPQMTNCFALGTVDMALENVPLDKPAKNCWVLSGTTHNMDGFTAGDKAAIKNAFAGLPNWDTAGDTPTLKNIGVVTDAGKYVPGTVETPPPAASQPAGTNNSGGTASTQSTAPVADTSEIAAMIEALPDPEEEGAVTLDCKEDVRKAYDAYNALSTGEKDDFDPVLAAKLNQVRYQVSLLLATDVVTRMENLPEVAKLTAADTEDILALWDDYNFLDDTVKNEIDKGLVEKLEAAYEFAQNGGGEAASVVTIDNGLTPLEWAITICCGVIFVLAVAFDIFAGVWLLRRMKKLKPVDIQSFSGEGQNDQA